MSVHVGQAEIPTAEAVGLLGVVDAQQMQQRRVQIVDLHFSIDDFSEGCMAVTTGRYIKIAKRQSS